MAEAAEQASADLGEQCDAVATKISRDMIGGAADTEEGNLGGTLETNTRIATNMRNELARLDGDGESGAGEVSAPETAPAAAPTGGDADAGPVADQGPDVPEAGQTGAGNEGTETGGTDPVDVVSGQLLAATADLALPGVLPLVLRRAYASGYRHGALFGPGWSSTLDIRLLVDEAGVRFLGDDAQCLDYGVPAGLGLGLAAYPEHGARWPLAVDRGRGEYRIQDPGSGMSWCFPLDGEQPVRPLASIIDRNGNRISVLRDERGLIARLVHDGGYEVAVEYAEVEVGGVPRVASLRLLSGVAGSPEAAPLVSFGYDDAGRLTHVTDGSGVPYVYEWDEHDRIRGWVDRNGYGFRYVYDDAGRVVCTEGDGGYLTAYLTYDPQQRVTTVTDSLGQPTEYHYDRFQKIRKIVDPLGGEIRTGYDQYGRLLWHEDQFGARTGYERDRDGNAVRIRRPDGGEVVVRYNAYGQPLEAAAPSGAIWRYAYDAAGNLTRETDPLGGTTTYEYTEHGAVHAVTDALGGTTRFEANAAGLPVRRTDPNGATTLLERDGFGRISAHTDPLGAVSRAEWNAAGQLLRYRDPAGASRVYEYDPAGNLVAEIDPSGGRSRFEYGPMGVRTAAIDATGARYGFEHDTELRLTSVTGPTGLTWSYEYDPAGRLIRERDFNARELTYDRDPAGRLAARTNGAGQTIRFDRDVLGRVTERLTDEGTCYFAYDADGSLTTAANEHSRITYVRDLMGRAVSETSLAGVLTREFDQLGRPTAYASATGATSRWRYDAAGLPQALVAGAETIAFAHDAAGREVAREFGQTRVTSAFDEAGRLAELTVRDADSRVVQQRAYGYLADGTPAAIHDRLRGNWTYTTDAASRVTEVNSADWSERYAYDALGNLSGSQQRSVDAAEDAVPADADAPGQASDSREHAGLRVHRSGRTAFEYDPQGRLVRKRLRTLSGQDKTWTYSWNAEDRLVRVETPDTGTWTYGYDPYGRRISKNRHNSIGGVVERFVYQWDGPCLIEERWIDQQGRSTITTWDYDNATRRPLAQRCRIWASDAPQSEIDAEFHGIVTDLIGTPQELVSPDGRVQWRSMSDLWGRTSVAPGSSTRCPLRFPGQYDDPETGLHYNLNRYYDPGTAAYLSPDPLGLAPAPHHYAYVPNPVGWADPLGLNGEQPTATQIRNTAGTAAGGENLPEVTGPWLRGSEGNAGRIPGQIADNLRGQSFKSFDDFREAFWKEVGKDPDLSAQFSPSNVTRMGDGHSPFTAPGQAFRGGRNYVLHHLTPIWDGGGVYDMDNLAVITPRYHAEILDPAYHYKK